MLKRIPTEALPRHVGAGIYRWPVLLLSPPGSAKPWSRSGFVERHIETRMLGGGVREGGRLSNGAVASWVWLSGRLPLAQTGKALFCCSTSSTKRLIGTAAVRSRPRYWGCWSRRR